MNGAIFFVDDLQNITSIGKADLALIIRDQFQWFGIEMLNYCICFSAKSDHLAETKALAILDQLGREKFRSDISKLSAKELEFIHQFASLGKGELAAHRFSHKFQRECFARLVEKDLLIRTGRGRCKFYHPLSREFLQQTQAHKTRAISGLPCSNHRADSIPLNPFPLTHSP